MNRPQEYIYHQLVNVSYWSSFLNAWSYWQVLLQGNSSQTRHIRFPAFRHEFLFWPDRLKIEQFTSLCRFIQHNMFWLGVLHHKVFRTNILPGPLPGQSSSNLDMVQKWPCVANWLSFSRAFWTHHYLHHQSKTAETLTECIFVLNN